MLNIIVTLKCGSEVTKVIESSTIWKFGYGFLTFPSLTLTLTLGLGVKVIENGAVRYTICDFLLVRHCNIALSCTIFELFAFYSNHGRICSRLWDI